jgi:hypothetical protein
MPKYEASIFALPNKITFSTSERGKKSNIVIQKLVS